MVSDAHGDKESDGPGDTGPDGWPPNPWETGDPSKDRSDRTGLLASEGEASSCSSSARLGAS